MKKITILYIICTLFAVGEANAQNEKLVFDETKKHEAELSLLANMTKPLDTLETTTGVDSLDAKVKKNGFFVKVYRYFQQSNVDKSYTKNIDFSVIGGPHYSQAVGVSLGIMCAGLYRTDYTDPLLQPSTLSIFGDISTTGFYLLGVSGNHHFPGRKHRLDYVVYFFSFPSGFWGFGYENGYGAMAGRYKRENYNAKVDYMYSVTKGLKIGANLSASYIIGKDWDENAKKLLDEIPNSEEKYFMVGAGVFMMYDTRDFIPNPSKGLYLKVDQRFYPRFLGNKKYASYSSTEVFFNAYKKLWSGAVVAYDFHSLFTYGNVPWTGYATSGGSYRMRGYYEGRFRDRMVAETTVELRQRVWRRIGVTAWVGCANVFPEFSQFRWDQTLPNWGVGLRWEFKKGINVRFDYGWGLKDAWGKRQQGLIFNLKEAF